MGQRKWDLGLSGTVAGISASCQSCSLVQVGVDYPLGRTILGVFPPVGLHGAPLSSRKEARQMGSSVTLPRDFSFLTWLPQG